jgi:hypothetical protein
MIGIRMGGMSTAHVIECTNTQALVVAAGGSYYYAKKDLKGRKLDPTLRESRLKESPGGNTNKAPITCTVSACFILIITTNNQGRINCKN